MSELLSNSEHHCEPFPAPTDQNRVSLYIWLGLLRALAADLEEMAVEASRVSKIFATSESVLSSRTRSWKQRDTGRPETEGSGHLTPDFPLAATT